MWTGRNVIQDRVLTGLFKTSGGMMDGWMGVKAILLNIAILKGWILSKLIVMLHISNN